MQQLLELLTEIKQTLQEYGQRHSHLIKKLQPYLQQSNGLNRQPSLESILQNETQVQNQLKQIQAKESEVVEQAQAIVQEIVSTPTVVEQVPLTSIIMQDALPIVQPTFSFYFLDLDSFSRNYQMVKAREENSGDYVKEIAELLLSYAQEHVKKLTLAQIKNKTKTEPKILKPIVFPLFENSHYAFIFEVPEYRLHFNQYQQSDRYLIFISRTFLPVSICAAVKKIAKLQYDDRFELGLQSYSLDSQLVALKTRRSLLDRIRNRLDQLQITKTTQQIQSQVYFNALHTYNIQVRTNDLVLRSVLILSLLIFYMIRQTKVVFIGKKQCRHIISENVMALRHSLRPIEYSYPTILAAWSQKHQNFIDTPVPCIIGYWGQRKRLRHMLKQAHLKTNQQPTVFIDLNQKILEGGRLLNQYQSQILIKINKYICKDSQTPIFQNGIVNRAHRLIQQQLTMASDESDFSQESKMFQQTCLYLAYKSTAKNQ